jgi:signal transduction histidine kinase
VTGLTAADALVRSVVPVDMYSRSAAGADRAEFYAVYTEPEYRDGAFLGVVPGPQTARFPLRVFADLLPKRSPPAVEPHTPLDAVRRVIEAEGVEAVPVVAGRGECVGVVTRASLSEAVRRREAEWARERAAAHDRLAEENRAIREQAARLGEELHRTRRAEEAGRLAVGVAHDLNNLLTVILGGCEVLLVRPDLDGDARSLLEEVRRAGEAAAALTRQLMAIGRLAPPASRPGDPAAAPPPVDLNVVLGDLAPLLRRMAGREVALTLELSSQPRPVRIDPGQVGRVLLNLTTNARDAMPRGGRLTLRTAGVRIWEGGDGDGDASRLREYTLLTVADTGAGMDAATLERVFEPFFTTKGPGAGTGLGLTIVRDIVGRSGGYVTVRSEVGQGTAFSLYFPQDTPGSPA